MDPNTADAGAYKLCKKRHSSHLSFPLTKHNLRMNPLFSTKYGARRSWWGFYLCHKSGRGAVRDPCQRPVVSPPRPHCTVDPPDRRTSRSPVLHHQSAVTTHVACHQLMGPAWSVTRNPASPRMHHEPEHARGQAGAALQTCGCWPGASDSVDQQSQT